jgi:hypothetical protein
LFEPPKIVYPLLLRAAIFCEISESSQSAIDLRDRFLVRLQVNRIVRKQVAALACFRIDGKAKDGTQLFLHFVSSLKLIVQSVITQGRSAGIRYHA